MSKLPPDLLAIKSTTHALIDACGGSEACKILLDGKSASLIRSYANPNVPDRYMPLDDVIALERHAQRPVVSAWGVERHNADPDRLRRAVGLADVAPLAKESAEAITALAEAFADGRFCSADRQRTAREIRDAIAVFSEILEAVESGL
ncbi:hypothetical protein [Aureimonas pseudogalii]|uniref:Thioredoxin-like negative regulator of GroEL n=1 Tax=Aureimonas pseudogalii TaxID=1744844 RepID=A0A7W6EES0_9HYPH|nr:hypothetical protein [Aureimonas pseudogalii]MBB3996898.1 thioredoxin-like negative regulator of GroEL [Aureimonas pseudogalii]